MLLALSCSGLLIVICFAYFDVDCCDVFVYVVWFMMFGLIGVVVLVRFVFGGLYVV